MIRQHPPRWCIRLLVVAVLGFSTGFVHGRSKTDVVTLTNGDRITGEVRSLNLGFLTVKTDVMETVRIEWPSVTRIESSQLFEVEDDTGQKHIGKITPADEQGRFRVVLESSGEVALEHDRIVRIAILEDMRRERWRGHLDLGFNYTSANSLTQLSFDGEAKYRSKKYLVTSALTTLFSDRDDAEETSWTTFQESYRRFLPRRWFWFGIIGWEQNQELDLKARSTFGAGAGRYLIQSNNNELWVAGGQNANREVYTDIEGKWTSEIMLGVQHEFFIFGGHQTKWSNSLTLFPSVTDWGRVRADAGTSLRRKLVGDLTFSLTVNYSYDSDPPAEAEDAETKRNDYRVVTSLGWTF